MPKFISNPLLLVIALTAGLSACSTGKTVKKTANEQGSPTPLVGSIQVHSYKLDNGLTLLVVEDHSSPTFAYQTWYRVGSRDEVPGRTGLAHLFEHMMFKQTKNLKDGEFDKILETAGAEGENAYTTNDHTTYIQELPKDKLDLIARLEAERMVNLVVDEAAFKTEREVVQNERRFRNENSPDGLMYQELYSTAYKKHPYHWPVIGYQEDLARMTAEDAMKFYRSYYSPNHAVIVVVGDVDSETVYKTVQKYYGEIPGQASPVKILDAEPAQTSPRRKTLKLNIQVEKLMMGYHTPDITHEDMSVLEVISSLLTGGKSSRLKRALVETGIASDVYSYNHDGKDPSLFILGANLQRKRKSAHAENVILRELTRLTRELVSEKELERAKNLLNYDFYSSLDSNNEKARFIGHYETQAKSFQLGLERYKKIQAVTPVEIQAVMKRYFSPNGRTVIIGVPK